MDNLIGHETIYKDLVNLYDKGNLPNKILLTGRKGIGKSLMTKKLLKYIYKNNNVSLIDSNAHPNIFNIFKKSDKKNIEISQIREMIEFQNYSSFNDLPKIIVIDDFELLNLNANNSLLKTLEEPNNKNFFILINKNNGQILETIKSRCIEFKLSLNFNEIKTIVDNHFRDDIFSKIPSYFINFYTSPSFIISLINFFNEIEISYNGLNIEELVSRMINDKKYSNNIFIKDNIDIFIELFFYKNINTKKNISYKLKEYFYLKLHQIKKYNLDFESFLMEFEEKLLSE